jgi:hypothetical protein
LRNAPTDLLILDCPSPENCLIRGARRSGNQQNQPNSVETRPAAPAWLTDDAEITDLTSNGSLDLRNGVTADTLKAVQSLIEFMELADVNKMEQK